MNVKTDFRGCSEVRVLWMLTIAAFAGGSFLVHTRYEPAIAAAYDRTETLYSETAADTRIVREARSLRAIRDRAEADLARVSHEASLSETTADLLSTLHVSARRFHTRVIELQPAAAPSSNGALQEAALTIRVQGTFGNILSFVADLSRHSTLMSVSDTSLGLAAAAVHSGAEPALDATIHATLYRLTMPGEKGVRVASNQ